MLHSQAVFLASQKPGDWNKEVCSGISRNGAKSRACILAWAEQGTFVLLMEWWASTHKPGTGC